MSTDLNQNQQNTYNSDEIDLFELIESIWKEKLLVILITAAVTAIALTYALITEPTYQASTIFFQPPANAIQSYNLGRKAADFDEYSITDIYDIFLTNLNSQQLRSEFFNEVYLPSLSVEQQQASLSALRNGFNNTLTVKQADPKGNKHLYQVTVELNDAEKAANWANLYLQKAITISKQEIEKNIATEIDTQKQFIKLKIDNLLAKAQIERQDEIIRLKEALNIAKTIGLENPSLPAGKTTEEGANYTDRNLTYLRGSKALQSQIQTLETRKDDHAFIPELRDLTAQLNLLNALTQNYQQAQVVKIDQLAQTPDSTIKPKTFLIVLIGIILGGMLGIITALIRTAIHQHKQQKTQP